MITYDGVDLGELMFIRDVQRPIMPSQSLETVNIEGRHGVLFMFKKHEAITLPVQVVVAEDSVELLNTRRREIAAALHKHEPKRLIFHDEPDKYIEGILVGESPLPTLATHGEATFNFFCPEPFWYAVEDDEFEFEQVGTNDFVRKGTVESEPIIEITGEMAHGQLDIDLNGNVMSFLGRLEYGETLVIDSKWMTAYILDAQQERKSVINDLSTLEFLLTRPGLNNFSVTSASADINSIKVICRSRWL
ncbi:MAG: phage tail family protein [bacterium]|nr:phage tail family protein [bacterium]